jgi:hypothetical protein
MIENKSKNTWSNAIQLFARGPILAIVSIVLPFAFWRAWQAHPSLG